MTEGNFLLAFRQYSRKFTNSCAHTAATYFYRPARRHFLSNIEIKILSFPSLFCIHKKFLFRGYASINPG